MCGDKNSIGRVTQVWRRSHRGWWRTASPWRRRSQRSQSWRRSSRRSYNKVSEISIEKTLFMNVSSWLICNHQGLFSHQTSDKMPSWILNDFSRLVQVNCSPSWGALLTCPNVPFQYISGATVAFGTNMVYIYLHPMPLAHLVFEALVKCHS